MVYGSWFLPTWFVLVSFIMYVSQWWFPLDSGWRIISLCAMFTATYLLVVQYNVKLFGKAVKSKNLKKDLGPEKTRKILHEIRHDQSLGRNIFLNGLLGGVYVYIALKAATNVDNVNDLYLYITGWALFCMVSYTQLRTHALLSVCQNLLRSKVSKSSVSKKPKRKRARAA